MDENTIKSKLVAYTSSNSSIFFSKKNFENFSSYIIYQFLYCKLFIFVLLYHLLHMCVCVFDNISRIFSSISSFSTFSSVKLFGGKGRFFGFCANKIVAGGRQTFFTRSNIEKSCGRGFGKRSYSLLRHRYLRNYRHMWIRQARRDWSCL